MSLLADIMVKGFCEDKSLAPHPVPEMLHDPVAIKCHQISRAWYMDGLSKKNDSDDLLERLSSLPTKPPFKSVWIEWEIPYAKRVQKMSLEEFDKLDWLPDGAFVLTDPMNESCYKAFIFAHNGFSEPGAMLTRPVLLGMVVVKWESGDFDNRLIAAELTEIGSYCARSAFSFEGNEEALSLYEGLNESETALMYFRRTGSIHTIELCLKTLHVKNVEVVEEPVKRKKKQRRLRPEQQISWHTVRVRPTGKKYTDCDSASLPTLTAHHLVRGHFATYSPEKPLFGKYVGTYWREAHTRGSKDAGEVAKDYEVVS